MLGVFGGLLLGILEAFNVLLASRPQFSGWGETLGFYLLLMLLPMAAGAIVGALEGWVTLGITSVSTRLAQQRMAEPKWIARIVTAFSLPVVALILAKAFEGRAARQLWGKDAIALGIGFALVGLVYVGIRLIVLARDRFRIRRWGNKQAFGLMALLVVAAALAYGADSRVLVGLYPFFHVILALAAAVCCQLIVMTVFAKWRRSMHWMGKILDPFVVSLIAIVLIAGAAWGIRSIDRSERLRFLVKRHTVVQSKLVRFVAGRGAARKPLANNTSSATPDPPALVAPHQTQLKEPSFLIISVDALRADHLGVYGYGRATTPSIDAWAKQATRFERAYCPVPHTSFSITSMLTGTHTYATRGGDAPTLAAIVRRHGYKTAGFFPPAVFYIDRKKLRSFEDRKFDFEYTKYEFMPAPKRVDQTIAFYQGHEKRKTFVWVHLFEPHEPYVAHEGFDFGSRSIDRYDSEIAYVDRQVGRLLSWVQLHRPNTVIALTGDHGEAFAEHGAHYHGNSLYEEQIRVPLLISAPGMTGRLVPGAGQSIDLPVTFLSLAQLPIPASMRGRDLSPWMAGDAPRLMSPAFVELGNEKAIITGRYKLIYDARREVSELYDLHEDPGEKRNLAAKKIRLAADLKEKIRQWVAGNHESAMARPDDELAALLERGERRDPVAISALTALLDRGTVEHRRQAIRLLLALRAPTALKAMITASGDSDPEVRLRATVGAALLGDRKSALAMKALLARSDLPPDIRHDVVLVWGVHGEKGATLALTQLLRQGDDLYKKIEIIELLGRMGDPAAAPELLHQMKSLRLRRYAIDALGSIRAPAARGALIEILSNAGFISWREKAASALGRIGGPSALNALLAAYASDPEPSVVEHCHQALAALGALNRIGNLRVFSQTAASRPAP